MNEPQPGASCAHESGYCHIWSMSCFMRMRKRPSQHSADLFGWLLLVNELLLRRKSVRLVYKGMKAAGASLECQRRDLIFNMDL